MKIRTHAGECEIVFASLAEAVSRLPDHVVFVTDSNVAALYRGQLPPDAAILVVEPGEASKSVEAWRGLQSQLAQLGAHRKTCIVALGGGVVGDLAGFVASSYMRGVPLVQMPTSLLAQVDSSVGGKVGIDLPEGKNLVGAFYPPERVFICDEVLDTLPHREVRNGMAEVWKYGFILDDDMLTPLANAPLDRQAIVRRCIELKARVVQADEFETNGERAKLNFGHTVGHAIERLTGYGPVLHGEAISIGMVAEARIGEELGVTEKGVASVVENSLRSAGLPTTSVVLRNVDMLIDTMRRDKKASAGQLAFSLLTQLGDCKLVENAPEEVVRAALAKL